MNRKIVITGATSGIGLETAKDLANGPYELILACRNPKKASALLEVLKKINPNVVAHVYSLDLSSFKSIQSFSESIHLDYESVDVLFNNAGLFMDKAMKTEEGFEMTMGVNYLGNHYLTHLLMDLILKGQSPQIINVSSKAAFYGKFKNIDNFFKNHSHGFKAYSGSKLLQVMMTMDMAEKIPEVSINAIYPGKVATGIWKGESLMMKIMGPINQKRYDTPAKAAKVGLHLIKQEKMWKKTGFFYEKEGMEIELNKKMSDKKMIAQLKENTKKTILEYDSDFVENW